MQTQWCFGLIGMGHNKSWSWRRKGPIHVGWLNMEEQSSQSNQTHFAFAVPTCRDYVHPQYLCLIYPSINNKDSRHWNTPSRNGRHFQHDDWGPDLVTFTIEEVGKGDSDYTWHGLNIIMQFPGLWLACWHHNSGRTAMMKNCCSSVYWAPWQCLN